MKVVIAAPLHNHREELQIKICCYIAFSLQVHQCYGDELGLTSDDEDYVAPGTEDDKLSASIGSFSEVSFFYIFI